METNKTDSQPDMNVIEYFSDEEITTNSIENPNENWINSDEHIEILNNVVRISVFDVAAYIVKKLGKVSTMKLQKLVYYCQAWSLVWDEQPLFDEKIEAWINGPVVRELFDFFRGMYTVETVQIGNPDLLNDKQVETIEAVINFYGDKSAQYLIDLTHMELPWLLARKGMLPTIRSNCIISMDSMQEYYSSL